MRDGYDICLEIGREADAKHPDDLDRALEFARAKAKREFGIGTETHPWVVDQILPTLRHTLHLARRHANQVLANKQAELPSIAPESRTLSTLPPERPKARQPDRKLTTIGAAILGRMATNIEGTKLGLLRGGDLPPIIKKRLEQARGLVGPAYVLDRILKSGKVAIDQQICEAMTLAEVDALFAEADQKLPGEVVKLIA